MKLNIQAVIPIVLLLVVIAAVFYFAQFNAKQSNEFHIHVNFAVYLNGVIYNFNGTKYMENASDPLRTYVHMHDGNGGLIHVHKDGLNLGFFFKSLGMSLNSSCFVLDNGASYCNTGEDTLKMYVNGQPTNVFENYSFHDLDKILISYGNHSQNVIQTQINSIPSDACIYSNKCPAPAGFINTEQFSCKTGEVSACMKS